LRVIYNASKMAVETALSGTSDLQAPVRLEVWDGIYMTAFKTGKTTRDGREILFMPTAPNITTGFVIEVENERYQELDDSVEDALTRLLSAGFGEKSGERAESSITEVLGNGSPEQKQIEDAIDESQTSQPDQPDTGVGPETDSTSGSDT
jgi:uncharacterized membrane protein